MLTLAWLNLVKRCNRTGYPKGEAVNQLTRWLLVGRRMQTVQTVRVRPRE
jgi:hypothetical protein